MAVSQPGTRSVVVSSIDLLSSLLGGGDIRHGLRSIEVTVISHFEALNSHH